MPIPRDSAFQAKSQAVDAPSMPRSAASAARSRRARGTRGLDGGGPAPGTAHRQKCRRFSGIADTAQTHVSMSIQQHQGLTQTWRHGRRRCLHQKRCAGKTLARCRRQAFNLAFLIGPFGHKSQPATTLFCDSQSKFPKKSISPNVDRDAIQRPEKR